MYAAWQGRKRTAVPGRNHPFGLQRDGIEKYVLHKQAEQSQENRPKCNL
jgi:hypothetical protein